MLRPLITNTTDDRMIRSKCCYSTHNHPTTLLSFTENKSVTSRMLAVSRCGLPSLLRSSGGSRASIYFIHVFAQRVAKVHPVVSVPLVRKDLILPMGKISMIWIWVETVLYGMHGVIFVVHLDLLLILAFSQVSSKFELLQRALR